MHDILVDFENIIARQLNLVRKLSFQISGAKLRCFTSLQPKLATLTRWSSVHDMVKRYLAPHSFILKIDLDELQALLLTDDEDAELKRLMKTLDKLKSVTKALQHQGMTLADARTLLDGVIESFPSLHSRLSTSSNLVDNLHFEAAIIKIQRGHERNLSFGELKAVQHLHRLESIGFEEPLEKPELSFAQQLLKPCRRNTASEKSKYLDLRFILASSNICERVFSAAGYGIGPRRKRTLLQNIESQLFLNVNANFWLTTDIHKMLTENTM